MITPLEICREPGSPGCLATLPLVSDGIRPGRVPDPLRTIRLDRWNPAGEGGKRWQNQREKKALILATARRLLAERGIEGVLIRDIAERCGFSQPTIYSIVGQRMELLGESAAEWIRLVAWSSPFTFPQPNTTLSILLAFWNSACDHPDYTTRAVAIACSPDAPLNRHFLTTGITMVRQSLRDQPLRALVGDGADLGLLAERLTMAVHADACNYALNRPDPLAYRRAFAYGPGVMLLGALRAEQSVAVEEALHRIATEAG